ncbi:hypothetical protein GJ496_002896 [Pomphorhynchus laevis]|nr:hypothetical protein GJ496_002896 [Pomphorhynchus laevis]
MAWILSQAEDFLNKVDRQTKESLVKINDVSSSFATSATDNQMSDNQVINSLRAEISILNDQIYGANETINQYRIQMARVQSELNDSKEKVARFKQHSNSNVIDNFVQENDKSVPTPPPDDIAIQNSEIYDLKSKLKATLSNLEALKRENRQQTDKLTSVNLDLDSVVRKLQLENTQLRTKVDHYVLMYNTNPGNNGNFGNQNNNLSISMILKNILMDILIKLRAPRRLNLLIFIYFIILHVFCFLLWTLNK